jgi:hypothetical protein
MIEVFTADAAILAALQAAGPNDLLYQKARAACATAALAAGSVTNTTAAGGGSSTQQQVVPVCESIYARTHPSDFEPVLNW